MPADRTGPEEPRVILSVCPHNPEQTTRFYLVDVWGGVEPHAVGPFADADQRDQQARSVRGRQDDEDTLFWADVAPDGTLTVGAYTNHFFEAAANHDPASVEAAP